MRKREGKQNERLQQNKRKTHHRECHHFLSKAFNRRNAETESRERGE